MSLTNLFKNYKKLGKKKFFEKWKEGIAKIPPETLLKLELRGYIINIVGVILAVVLTLIFARNLWIVIPAYAFAIIIYIAQALQTYQKIEGLKQFQTQMIEINAFLKNNENETDKLSERESQGIQN